MTAVEFILNLVTGEDASGKDVKVIDVIDINEIKQANKLFEKQIVDAWNDGLWGKLREGEDNAEQYYNETFKSEL